MVRQTHYRLFGKSQTLLTAGLLGALLCGSAFPAVIWEEDFTYADGTTNGPSGEWSVDVSACNFDGDDHFEVRSGQMQGNDLDGEAIWTSESISISGQGSISVFASVSDVAGGLESSDYIRLYYRLDGGAETLFETNGDNSGNFGDLTASQSGLTGSSLQLIIKAINGANTEFIAFDNITVSGTGTAPSNSPPILSLLSSVSIAESNSLSFVVEASDVDNDIITLSASNLPLGAVFNTVANAGTVSNTFNWAIAAPTGTYTTTFYADDGTTNVFEAISITVTNPPAISGEPPVLDAVGNKSATEGDTVTFDVTASDPIDSDPITLSATNLPSGAVFSNGTFTWSNAAPAGVYSVTFFATDKDGSDSETISITIAEKPVLMITEVADPAGTGGGNYRFVEIYNAGNSTVDLSNWYLCVQVNGGSWDDVSLSGSIVSGGTWVIAYNTTYFQQAYGFTPDQADGNINGTGDDAYFLYTGGDHSSGTLVDIYGEVDTDGSDTDWEYTDSRALRNNSATGPSTTWVASEWTIVDGATTTDMDPGAAYHVPPVLSAIGNQGGMEGGTISFTISAVDLTDGDAVTYGATNLPTGASFSGDTFTWNNVAPVGQYPVTFFAYDIDGTNSETVVITVIEKPLLIFSEIADPADDGGDAYRFIELYNAGTNTIDLAADEWYISKQVNGDSWYDIELSGTIAPAAAWVIANGATDFEEAYGFAPDQESSTISGNGDDAYFLYTGGSHYSGTLVDIFGEFDTDGTDTDWDYEDSRAVRNNDVLEPNSTWTASEWTITSSASTNSMTPGEHGPKPQFQGLEDIFVFPGAELSLIVTAVNTVRTDVITIAAINLPGDAVFPIANGSNTVSSTLSWNNPTSGVYTITFAAIGDAGITLQSVELTVSSTANIDGYFYGWKSDTIVKLDNGQFWRNTGGSGETLSSRLRKPEVTVTNVFGKYRMFVEDVASYTTVEQIDVIESVVTNTFSGLYNGNVYQLEDGTAWKQISYDNISSSADPVTAWRWIDDGDTFMRFFDRYDERIGTCKVSETTPSSNGPTITAIDGYFRGWKKNRVFALANGEFWQQTTADSSVETLYRPTVTITNYLQLGTWRMYVEEAVPGYVEVQQLTNVVNTAIDGKFYGFSKGEFIHLDNGEWWRQTSYDSSTSIRANPDVLLWEQDGVWQLEMPDEGHSVSAEQLTVTDESTITNDFSGIRYANTYELAGGKRWMQISFENISSDAETPAAMLWAEEGYTNLLVRTTADLTIGSCKVVNPDADDDGDQIANAAEIIAGTDMADKDVFFVITETQIDGNGHYVLSWDAVSGRTYTILWAASLDDDFLPISVVNAPTSSWTDTLHTIEESGFYQIEVGLTE